MYLLKLKMYYLHTLITIQYIIFLLLLDCTLTAMGSSHSEHHKSSTEDEKTLRSLIINRNVNPKNRIISSQSYIDNDEIIFFMDSNATTKQSDYIRSKGTGCGNTYCTRCCNIADQSKMITNMIENDYTKTHNVHQFIVIPTAHIISGTPGIGTNITVRFADDHQKS